MHAVYTEEGEVKFWDVTITVGGVAFHARRSALFAACVAADNLYRESR